MKTIVCPGETETERLGEKLIAGLRSPAFIALYGELGAGKTAFVRGMGAYLGTYEVRSPTFTIVHEYQTSPKLIHFDTYRLSDAEELYAIGFDDYLAEDAIIVVEWAERVADALPNERLELHFCGSGDEPRVVTINAIGERYREIEARL